MAEQQEKLVEVENLVTYFPIFSGVLQKKTGEVKAVDDISFFIRKGETLGLVGESGCGKTTTGRSILKLEEPTSGSVIFDGKNLIEMEGEELRRMRSQMQPIFQDPFASLNPRMNVGDIIGEPLEVHNLAKGKELTDKVNDLLEKVGLAPEMAERYPHEFSGGQRQRIGIARALAAHPAFIVCDEAVSALDVSIQAQIINLLQSLQKEDNLSLLFISHDLNVVKHLSQRTAVMYLGKIIEIAPTEMLNLKAAHPYTQALLSSKPSLNPSDKKRPKPLEGDVPSPLNPPTGCHFHPRCPEATNRCIKEIPRRIELEKGHFVNCHLYEE